MITVLVEGRRQQVLRFLERPAGEIVKDNAGRTVWRTPDGLYVKKFKIRGLGGRLRQRVADRALTECRVLQELAAAGIAAPVPVAVARDDGASWLFTEEIRGGFLVAQILRLHSLTPQARRDILARVAGLAARLHAAGFDHRDLHVGNILMGTDGLYVLDVHRAARKKTLPDSRRRDAVAFLAMSFLDLVPRTDLLRFFRACGLGERAALEDVFRRLDGLQHRYFRSRAERCVRDSSTFAVRDGVFHRREADLDRVLAAARGAGGTPVPKKGGPPSLFILPGKLFLKKAPGGRALDIWRNSHALEVRSIPVPKLLAASKGWVVGRWQDGPNLYDFVVPGFSNLGRAGRDDLLFRLARQVRRMHDRGALHKDLKSANVVVTPQRILFVDLDRVSFSRAVTRAGRILNLAQLNASLVPPVTRTDRLRFLRWYFGRDRDMWRAERSWVEDIMKLSRARRHYWPPP